MKFQTIVSLGINLGIIEFIGAALAGGVLDKVPQVHPGGKNLQGLELVKNIKNG